MAHPTLAMCENKRMGTRGTANRREKGRENKRDPAYVCSLFDDISSPNQNQGPAPETKGHIFLGTENIQLYGVCNRRLRLVPLKGAKVVYHK